MVYIRLFACFEPSSPSDVQPMCSHMHQMCGNVLLFNGTAWDGLGRAKMQNPQCLCELGRWDGHHGGSLPTPQISYQAGLWRNQSVCPKHSRRPPTRRHEAPCPVSRRLTSPSAPAQSAERGL